ncbi:MAG: ABC transporter permease [Bacteroides sp.]|nr:ABC transporter permease [Eubacterium sp.]MCM1419669.1 ABC transporter permease [Roseburia sp.]MCM1463638.1 ABC transporter permease [Bacteroides sp.]
MTRLLRAGFRRMLRGKLLWLCMALLLATALLDMCSDFLLLGMPFRQETIPLELQLFNGVMNVGLFLAIFTGRFLGEEQAEGGFRNKLVVGHTRGTLYLSNLILCLAAGAMLFAADFPVRLAVGLARGFTRESEWSAILFRVSVALIALAAVTALLVLIGMLVRSRSVGVVCAIGLLLALTVSGASIHGALAEPEYLAPTTIAYPDEIGADGEPRVETILEKNPFYVTGAIREVFKTLDDILPGDQLVRVEAGDLPSGATLPGYSAGIFLLATASGAMAFRRRELK